MYRPFIWLLCALLMLPACAQQPSQPSAVTGVIAHPAVPPPAPAPAQSASADVPAPAVNPVSLPAPRIVTFERTAGPFQVNGQSFTFIKHVQSIDRRPHNPADDETVEWWELRDAAGNTVYRQQFGVSFRDGAFEETEDVGARSLKTGGGEGILVDGESLPSAPDTGTWVQLFGLFNGKLVPFGGPISTYGEFLGEGEDSFQPSVMVRGQQPTTVTRDVLNFRVWTGNFNIIYPVLIDWMQAQVRPAWTCYRMSAKGMVSACSYKVQVQPAREDQALTFVRLFSEPEEGFAPKHAVIKPDSKIEYLEGQMAVEWKAGKGAINFGVRDGSDVWLHIRIDGQEGWIHTQEDFEAVGLPAAG